VHSSARVIDVTQLHRDEVDVLVVEPEDGHFPGVYSSGLSHYVTHVNSIGSTLGSPVMPVEGVKGAKVAVHGIVIVTGVTVITTPPIPPSVVGL
jgi:hypothetical protein